MEDHIKSQKDAPLLSIKLKFKSLSPDKNNGSPSKNNSLSPAKDGNNKSPSNLSKKGHKTKDPSPARHQNKQSYNSNDSRHH